MSGVTRIRVLERDGFRCCYCNEVKAFEQLNVDHVIPISRGGRRRGWTNVVTSCFKCNEEKGDRTPQEAGMVMHFQPFRPGHLPPPPPPPRGAPLAHARQHLTVTIADLSAARRRQPRGAPLRPSCDCWVVIHRDISARAFLRLASRKRRLAEATLDHLAQLNPHLTIAGQLMPFVTGDEVNVPPCWLPFLVRLGFQSRAA